MRVKKLKTQKRCASRVAAGDRTSACVGNCGHSHTPGCGQLKQRKTLLKTTVRARGALQIQPCSPTFCTSVSASYCVFHTAEQDMGWRLQTNRSHSIHSGVWSQPGLRHGSRDSPARAVGLTQGASPGGEG